MEKKKISCNAIQFFHSDSSFYSIAFIKPVYYQDYRIHNELLIVQYSQEIVG